jgi:hypothetical protein
VRTLLSVLTAIGLISLSAVEVLAWHNTTPPGAKYELSSDADTDWGDDEVIFTNTGGSTYSIAFDFSACCDICDDCINQLEQVMYRVSGTVNWSGGSRGDIDWIGSCCISGCPGCCANSYSSSGWTYPSAPTSVNFSIHIWCGCCGDPVENPPGAHHTGSLSALAH